MKTLIWAHRGASAYAPENTLEAFALAAKMNADGIELDVHRSKDGQIVVSHDGRLGRCTKDSGANICDLTYEELSKFNFNCGMNEQYPFCKIPLLSEVFECLKDTPLTVNVELKHGGIEFLSDIAKTVRDYGMHDRIIYSSFSHYALWDMINIDPKAFTAPLYGGEIFKPWDYAKSFNAKAIHPHFSPVIEIPDYVTDCHKAGVRIHPWTVDEDTTMKKLILMGVDAIITNRPDVALKIRDEIQ